MSNTNRTADDRFPEKARKLLDSLLEDVDKMTTEQKIDVLKIACKVAETQNKVSGSKRGTKFG